MVDIHAHILPGIDDGATDIYDTLQMAELAVKSGVTAIVATPHCNIPGEYSNYINEEYKELFWHVTEALHREKLPIQILPGAEVFATYDLPELIRDNRILTLNGSRYLLMEFAFDEDPGFAENVLERVQRTGIIPVIAHAERYGFVQEIPQIACEWREKGYLIQINKGSALGRFGRRAKSAAHRMLEQRIVSVAASDAHSPRQRTTYMLDAYEELCVNYPKKYMKILFEDNPRRICENRPVIRYRSEGERNEIF